MLKAVEIPMAHIKSMAVWYKGDSFPLKILQKCAISIYLKAAFQQTVDIYIDGVSTEVWQFPDSKLVFVLQCYQVAFISKCFPAKTSDIFWLLQL